MIYSFSRLDLFSKCPYRWYLKYILGRKEPVTKPLALGKAVHKAIELRIKGVSKNQAVMAALIEAGNHPEVTKEEVEQLMERAPRVLGDTEVHFNLPLSVSQTAPRIQGYIDLVKPGKFIDWKSNWRMYQPNFNMQLRLYAWALMEKQGERFIEGSLFFLRFKRYNSAIYSKDEGDIARQWALSLAEQIVSKRFVLELYPEKWRDIFPAQTGSHCSHCPFAIECVGNFKSIV